MSLQWALSHTTQNFRHWKGTMKWTHLIAPDVMDSSLVRIQGERLGTELDDSVGREKH